MIVLADGRNVFPEDVERALLRAPGVKDAAVIGLPAEGGERVHAVLLLEPSADPEIALASANATLEDHQKIRGYTRWTGTELPRTEGTRKLKRSELRKRLTGDIAAQVSSTSGSRPADRVDELLQRWTSGRAVTASTSLDDLGLSSLDRVELLVALEQKLGEPVDESIFASAKTVADVAALQGGNPGTARAAAAFSYPTWNRRWLARAFRVINLNLWLLHLAHVFAWVRVEGREHLDGLKGPVLFASNHQSFFDTPSIFIALPWSWRRRLAPTMRKEFFEAHFNPREYGLFAWITNSLNYWLSLLMFNALPIPQHEAGTRQALRALGELVEAGDCPLIFPEGRHSPDENLLPFQAGAAMIASRLRIPVVPIRLRGSNRVLPAGARMARPGRVTVFIGEPLRLEGEDYAALTRLLEERIRAL
jgi:long-chain acyl-CoA synthetase